MKTHEAIHIYLQNVSQILQKTTKNNTRMSLGDHWLMMDPFGVTFGTLRLRLDTIWGVLGSFLVSLGFILETLGSILRCLGHLNATQSCPECHLDSQSRFSERFFIKSSWILLQLHVFEGSSKVVFWDFATVARFQ